jgi:hypothetical protein
MQCLFDHIGHYVCMSIVNECTVFTNLCTIHGMCMERYMILSAIMY